MVTNAYAAEPEFKCKTLVWRDSLIGKHLCKHKDLSLDPQHHIKDNVACVYNPSIGGRLLDPWNPLTSHPNQLVSSRLFLKIGCKEG